MLLRSSIKIRKEASKKTKIKPSQELEYFREMPRKNATPAQAVYVYNEVLSTVSTNQMGNIFSATLLDLCLKKYIGSRKILATRKKHNNQNIEKRGRR